MSIVRKATKSILWMFADSWLSLVWAIVYMAIMARLLGPDVFGIMALAGACLGIAGIFLSDTLTEGLKQFDDLYEEHENAAFWINTSLSLFFAIAVIVLAAPIAEVLNSEILAQILPAMALISLIGTLSDVPEALLERDLEHKKLVILEAVIDVPTSFLAIALALLGFGIWSLIISAALSTLVSSIALFWLAKWTPGLRLSRQHASEVITFARDTFLTRSLDYVDSALPTFALGYFVGERALGLYSIAMNLAAQFSGLIMGPLSEIAMSVIARLQNSLDQIRKLLDDVFQVTTFVMYPAIIGACLIAPLAAPLVFGDKWAGIELPLIIALLLGLRHATGDFNIAILRGLGDTRSPLIILSIGVVFLAALLPIAVQFGLIGVMVLVALRVFATWPLSAWFVERRSGYPARNQFTIGWRALICALVMASVVLAAMSTSIVASWPAIFQIATMTLLGVIMYLSLFVLLWPQRLRGGIAQLKVAIVGSDGEDEDQLDLVAGAP
ncbi:MAG: oligosaccharide flippase family protein [Pseudomonadota bacterium]